MAEKVIQKIPSKEIVWMTYVTESKAKYRISSNAERTLYYLYKEVDNGVIKIAKGKAPPDLYEVIERDDKNTTKGRK